MHANRWPAEGISLRGFAFDVSAARCLTVESAIGCSAQILDGEAWITEDGDPRDTIAGSGASVSLTGGMRYTVSAFREAATLLITAARDQQDVEFVLHTRNGMRVLAVGADRWRALAMLAKGAAAFAAGVWQRFASLSVSSH